MKKLLNFFLISIFSLFVISCTYEKINSTDQKKFHIVDITVEGEKRSAFLVRKKINRLSNIDSSNKIKILVKLSSKKEILEKNIQNKVTKYKLSIAAQVEVKDLNTNRDYKRSYSASQSYDVEDRYSATVNNSKEANINLINKIVDEILDQLKIFYT